VHSAHFQYLLVVVLIINQLGISTLKGEGHTPVSIHRHRVMPGKVASQRVNSPARRVHIIRAFCTVQHGQHYAQLSGMVRLYACLASLSEECLKPFVTERLNHVLTVSC